MNDQFFAGMRPARPGRDVKVSVLQAARAAMHARVAPKPGGVWLGRFDATWAATLLVLVLCHVLLSLSRRPEAVAEGSSPSVAERTQLEKELGLKGVSMLVARRDAREDVEMQRQLRRELERL